MSCWRVGPAVEDAGGGQNGAVGQRDERSSVRTAQSEAEALPLSGCRQLVAPALDIGRSCTLSSSTSLIQARQSFVAATVGYYLRSPIASDELECTLVLPLNYNDRRERSYGPFLYILNGVANCRRNRAQGYVCQEEERVARLPPGFPSHNAPLTSGCRCSGPRAISDGYHVAQSHQYAIPFHSIVFRRANTILWVHPLTFAAAAPSVAHHHQTSDDSEFRRLVFIDVHVGVCATDLGGDTAVLLHAPTPLQHRSWCSQKMFWCQW
ncbi:hypothetical protein C8F01DRAFT_1231520 [Mycena amicta]|nr:hypothetical protein C8F01DRAFT_1231520 [Mycena amicta]